MKTLIQKTTRLVQSMERIFKLKEYNDEKAFKLIILNVKGYASLLYENLKRNRGREAKSKIKTWSKLKKNMEKKVPITILQVRALPGAHFS